VGGVQQLAIEVGWLDTVGDRIQIFICGAETLQDAAQRINPRAVRLRPAGGELDTGDGIVTATDSNALAAAVAVLASVVVARVAADALTCAHARQL
jgi:pyridoxal biosynthesis lyase PdxS